ncbi:MAG TPA: LytR C-terminal domain-containing protein [Acidimicrobiia bacterium]
MSEASTGLVDEGVEDAVHGIAIEPGPGTDPEPTLSRAQRERARRDKRSRNRRNEVLAVCVALVVGAIAALSTSPRHASSAPARSAAPSAVPAAAGPHTVLFVHYNAAHSIDLAALVGVNAGGRTGSFVFVPPPTYVDVPALDLEPVGSLLRLGDQSLLLDVIENTTGVHVSRMASLDDTTLARAFAVVPSLTITFPHAITVSDSGGSLTYPAGRVRGITPSQAVRLMTDKESGGSLVHLATVQAVLQGWFGALRASPSASRQAAAIPAAAPFAALASVTAMHYDVLPVVSSTATGGERYDVDQPAIDQLARSDFGYARLGGPAPRPKVELLNGVGTAGLTQRAARIVVPAGGFVTLTDNKQGFGQRTTKIVYYDPSQYATAQRFARVLGLPTNSVVRGAIPLYSVDITVVIGRDFVKQHP